MFLHSYLMILQVKILIIDSVSFLFRQDFDDLALRTRILSEMSLKLMKLAKSFNLAVSFNKEETFRFSSQNLSDSLMKCLWCVQVVLLNQVTTKFTEGSFHLSLALGR